MKGYYMVYREYHENLTTDAAVLFSYIRDVEQIIKDRDGDYFRLSNSFIQELFWDWGSDKIAAKLKELVREKYIDVKQKYKVERKSVNKTRWVKIIYNPEANTELNTEANTELNTDSITVKSHINNNIKTTKETKKTIYNDETSSSMYSTSSTENNSPDDFLSKKDTLTNMAPPSDPEEKFSDRIKEIVAYLNEKTNSRYRENTPNTRKHIIARLKQDYTVDDFKHVIDVKCAEWKGTEFEKFLRPDTLFGSKFENYLQQKMPAAKNGKPVVTSEQAKPEDILWDEVY